MRNHNYGAVLLVALAALVSGVGALSGAPQALAAAPAFTVVDANGNTTPDYIDSDNATHYDVTTIVGAGSDMVVVGIDAATTWNLTGPNAGTISAGGYSSITFSGIGSLVAGDDDDRFVFLTASTGLSIDGGLGTNTLDYSSRTANVSINLAFGSASGTSGVSYVQNVIGGAGADSLTGDGSDNVFTGGPGKDIITGGGGLDTVAETRDADLTLTNTGLTVGGVPEDMLSGIEAARLTGGPANNTLNALTFSGEAVLDGGDGNDTLRGGSGADVLIGGEGDDAMIGNGGSDQFTGGPGTNTITESGTSGDADTIVETCDSDFELTDTGLVWSEGKDQAGVGTFLGNIEKLDLTGGPGDNDFSISVGAGGSISVEGGEGYDSLILDPESAAVELVANGLAVPSCGQYTTYMAVEAVRVVGLIDMPADMTVAATSSAGATVDFTVTADNPLDPLVVSCDPASGSSFPVGTTTVHCTATDTDGNAVSDSFTVTVTPFVAPTISWSGFLQPINADGSSVFKLKSTVPVKFALTGDSAGVTDLAAKFYYVKVDNGVTGDEVEAVITSAATAGNLFRYDPASGQYIFNWGTKGLTSGTYRIRVDLGDGVATHTVLVSLK
jgi:hypothetical protein